jgi:superfamily II DNA/RNA helicase
VEGTPEEIEAKREALHCLVFFNSVSSTRRLSVVLQLLQLPVYALHSGM